MARSRNRKKSRRPPKISWGATTRAYQKDLFELVRFINNTVREQLFPQLKVLAEQQQMRLGLEVDSPLEEVESVFDSMKLEYEREFSDAEKAAIAQKNGDRGQRVNKAQVDRQLRALGFDIFRDSPGLGDTMDGFNRANTKLIKSLSNTAYDRMENVIERGFREGKSAATLTKELQNEFSVTRNRAILIARDQMGKLNGQLTRERHLANGITHSEWITANDGDRVRPEHQDREGRKFDNKKGISGEFPGGPVNCRCFASPLPPG